ncbi:MAG TPA: SDR family oxidoreductase [Nitrososphaera sp.]|nr:SDR family oxidoreductase [Nitrososphaera sp.]
MVTNLEGKTCLVTGATSGIGKEIARGLAEMGATVVLVGRTKEKCELVRNDIRTRTGSGSRVSYLVADLSSQASIRQLARQYADGHSRLDVLVNNAGAFRANRNTTTDGIEYTFAVNHLAPFLLTNLLLDLIKRSAPARIITTSSVAHRGARIIDFDDVQFEKRSYNGFKAYSLSKLANILFTRELAERLSGTGVTANCFHPGGVRTNLARENPWYYRLAWSVVGLFFISPEKGADTAIYLASSSDAGGITGKYFVKRKPVKPSDDAESKEAAVKLWEISERLTRAE